MVSTRPRAKNDAARELTLTDRLERRQQGWRTYRPSERIKQRLSCLASMSSPNNHTHWDLIYEIIVIAAEFLEMQDEIHEVALPIDEQKIKAWNPVSTGWILPGTFRVTNNDQQGALCKEVGKLYEQVAKSLSKNTQWEFATWEYVRSLWSGCASFFRTYYFLHPHLSKKEAFDQAKAIGESKIRSATDRIKIEKSLILDAKVVHFSGRVNFLLSTLEKVAPQACDSQFTNDYYMYKDEDQANAVLRDFFAAKQVKTGSHKDMVMYSKKWIKSKISATDRENFKQFLNLYSTKEVAAQKIKKAGNKRTREEIEQEKIAAQKMRIERSKEAITDERKLALAQQFKAGSPRVLKLYVFFRTKVELLTKGSPRPKKRFNPISGLGVRWDSNWRGLDTVIPGGYVWHIPMEWQPESVLLQHLFASLKNFRAEIPALEGVDDSLDSGKLRQKVEECQSTIITIRNVPRYKCKAINDLKKLILQAWNLYRKYRSLEGEVTPKVCNGCDQMMDKGVIDDIRVCQTCSLPFHRACGSRFDGGKLDCGLCCIDKKTNPPRTDLKLEAGSKWKKLQVERYVMIMNFVNCMLTKDEVAACLNTDDDPSRGQGLQLRLDAIEVLIALEMHEVSWMGDAPEDAMVGLNSWLPTFYRPSCCAYLTFFHKISTTETLDTIRSKVLKQYFKQNVGDCLNAMFSEVKHHSHAVALDRKAAGMLTNMAAGMSIASTTAGPTVTP
jgi:hypothetical protein